MDYAFEKKMHDHLCLIYASYKMGRIICINFLGEKSETMNREQYRKAIAVIYKFASWLHLAIFFIILTVLCLGIVGFLNKWIPILTHPFYVLTEFHQVAEDIFSLILVFEIMELLRQRNPMRLTDILLTVLARKILLSPADSSLIFIQSISFCLVLVCRIIWSRFHEGAVETKK
jgi:hypothetical protein